MALCKNCGNQIDDNVAFCDKCGTPTGAQAAQPAQTVEQPVPVQPVVLSGDADVQQNKGMAVLSYLGLLLLIPLFARKNSDYCKYHVKQGVTLACCEIIYSILTLIINAIVGAICPPELVWTYFTYAYVPSMASTVVSTILSLGSIFFLVLMIIGIVNAAQGQKKELPLLGKIKVLDGVMNKIYASLNK